MGTGGHLFVVRADITRLRCDAWLCPTDPGFNVSASFSQAVEAAGGHFEDGQVKGLHWDTDPALALPGADGAGPVTVLADVGHDPPSDESQVELMIAELLGSVEAFVEVAIEECARSASDRVGDQLMLALPLIGTGEGGFDRVKGDVVRGLVGGLQALAEERNVDLVLCVPDPMAYSAVQRARSGLYPEIGADESLAQELAAESRQHRLVLFMGAGSSRDADLPGWSELLTRIGDPDRPIDGLGMVLDPRDTASLLERELESREALIDHLRKELVEGKRFGLTHALLASLGVREAITTNYDTLFEQASTPPAAVAGDAVTVLPYELAGEGRPWLLKLHGSLGQPVDEGSDDLVITRSDYSRLRRERGALFGIVQAVLVTKHLLFVGYSLNDEDFHELVDEIRTAVGPALNRQLGTVLAVERSPLTPIWEDILDVQVLTDDRGTAGVRRLLVLLDRIAHLATPHYAYLMNDAYEGLLGDGESDVADSLKTLREKVDALGGGPVAEAVDAMLRQFGSDSGGEGDRSNPSPR